MFLTPALAASSFSWKSAWPSEALFGNMLRLGDGHGNDLQNTTLMIRMMSSSGEKIVSRRGKRGAAVTVARRVMSSR